MAKELPINSRIVEQLSKATIRTLVDGIVELITNSDDSYRRLEEAGHKVKGEILISVGRKKGGVPEKLVVKDWAEGMTKDDLEKAIVFGGETSGFESGRSVRGLFGRGLKETIIALGEGEIKTVRNGKQCRTKVWWDKKSKKAQYDDELLNNIEETPENNGTEVNIKITNERIKIPEYQKFVEQLSNHYALRDIMASPNREVRLRFNDLKRGQTFETPITFSYPKGKIVRKEEINLPEFGDKVEIIIYESPTPLDSPRYNPYGLAGILIKTKGAILDNQLFKFENDPAALYFFGEAICNGLEERLRKGETEIIDPNRAGLEWRHEYCQTLANMIEMTLEPLILEKRKELEKRPAKEMKVSTKRMLEKLRNLLNELAKKELEELEEPFKEPEPDITNLLIVPEVANIQKDIPRTFSIYAPTEVVKKEGSIAHIKSDTLDIQPLASNVKLEMHPKYPEKLWYRYFKVVGRRENAGGVLTVTLGNEKTLAKVKVTPPKEKKKGLLRGRKGGFISDIQPDESESPSQRTYYDKNTGIIRIYTKFPSVAKFIKDALEGVETVEGKILLAELVGEAFSRELATRKLESNPPPPGGEIAAFNNEVNMIQKRTLHLIQEIIFAWKFK